MLRQQYPTTNLFTTTNIHKEDHRKLLLDIIQENHLLYHMETRDRPNNIIRLLIELFQLGATPQQFSQVYQAARLETESIRVSTSTINESNWQEYLGTSLLYSDYLVFFDQQLSILGLEATLDRYFYAIPTSIGSQLQPLVHLAFGIQHDLPLIITQALAYYATSYLDVSALLTEISPNVSNTYDSNIVDKLIFDLVHSDQRFDGKIEGCNTFQSSIKLFLKSKSDLLKTYVTTWSLSTHHLTVDQHLDALLHTSLSLRRSSGSEGVMDWFLAGGQLTDAAMAIKWFKNPQDYIPLLFLSTLCTYVVQCRPPLSSNPAAVSLDWTQCTQTILASSDPKAILAYTSLHKLKTEEALILANHLTQFVMSEGIWVKGGLNY